MSGELILENGSWWKERLPAAAATALASALVVCPISLWLSRRGVEGLMLHIGGGILVLVLWWSLYPVVLGWLSKGSRDRIVSWTVTPDTLVLGEASIPRESIKMVHCWPNRNALGTSAAGWTVNIETTGKNRVLRSLTEGEDVERSVRLLGELVAALGYRWPE